MIFGTQAFTSALDDGCPARNRLTGSDSLHIDFKATLARKEDQEDTVIQVLARISLSRSLIHWNATVRPREGVRNQPPTLLHALAHRAVLDSDISRLCWHGSTEGVTPVETFTIAAADANDTAAMTILASAVQRVAYTQYAIERYARLARFLAMAPATSIEAAHVQALEDSLAGGASGIQVEWLTPSLLTAVLCKNRIAH